MCKKIPGDNNNGTYRRRVLKTMKIKTDLKRLIRKQTLGISPRGRNHETVMVPS
jgi:hypothetical protein